MIIQIMPTVGYIIREATSLFKIRLRKYIITQKPAAFTFTRLRADPQKIPASCFLFVWAVLDVVPFRPQLLQKHLIDLTIVPDGIHMPAGLGYIEELEVSPT